MKTKKQRIIGFCVYRKRTPEELEDLLKAAQKSHYDFIDCAWRYGNEAGIGMTIKTMETSKKSKPFYFKLPIQSKIWPSQYRGGVNKSLKNCLQKLGGIKEIESYLLHRPHYDVKVTISAWKQLIDCKRQGMAKYIGVANFDRDLIETFEKSNLILPNYNLIELSVNNMRWDRIKYCQEKNIVIQAYRPLGNLEANLQNPKIIAIAKKHNATVPQVLLAYLMHFGIIPIVSSCNPKHIAENIKAKKIFLDQQDINSMVEMNTYSNAYHESLEIDLEEINREESSLRKNKPTKS